MQVRERKPRLPTDTKSETGLAGEWSNPGYGAGMFPDVSSIKRNGPNPSVFTGLPSCSNAAARFLRVTVTSPCKCRVEPR
jgi:hypothetical protein